MRNDVIIAIEARKLLKIRYSRGERLVEPYAIGVSTSGNQLLRAYQLEGSSESNEKSGWRLFKIDEIENVSLNEESFSPREEYKRGDKVFLEIFSQI